MVVMFFPAPARNQDVVQVDEGERQVLADGVHQPLECLGGIFKPQRGPQEFEESERGDYRGLVDIFWCDRDLMIPPDEVDLREESATVQLGGEVLQMWNGILIVRGSRIEAPKIPAGAPGPIVLPDQM